MNRWVHEIKKDFSERSIRLFQSDSRTDQSPQISLNFSSNRFSEIGNSVFYFLLRKKGTL